MPCPTKQSCFLLAGQFTYRSRVWQPNWHGHRLASWQRSSLGAWPTGNDKSGDPTSRTTIDGYRHKWSATSLFGSSPHQPHFICHLPVICWYNQKNHWSNLSLCGCTVDTRNGEGIASASYEPYTRTDQSSFSRAEESGASTTGNATTVMIWSFCFSMQVDHVKNDLVTFCFDGFFWLWAIYIALL